MINEMTLDWSRVTTSSVGIFVTKSNGHYTFKVSNTILFKHFRIVLILFSHVLHIYKF